MKNKLNIGFFSICLIASLIAESYFIYSRDWFSIIGIGAVGLILGYLLIDSIRTKWKQTMDKLKNIIEIYEKQANQENDRYKEAYNLQKATYTVLKKNTLLLNQKYDELSNRLDSFEKKNEQMLKLQRKALEGQKNALNIEVNYNKENTEHLIRTIREEIKDIITKQKMTDLETIENRFISEDSYEINNKAQAEIDKPEPSDQSNIIPPYKDPYKELTREEIDQLFSSYDK